MSAPIPPQKDIKGVVENSLAEHRLSVLEAEAGCAQALCESRRQTAFEFHGRHLLYIVNC